MAGVLLELGAEYFDEAAAAVLRVPQNIGRAIQELALPLLKHHYETFVETYRGKELRVHSGDIRARRRLQQRSSAVHRRRGPARSDRPLRGGRFHAIGRGSAIAQQAGDIAGPASR